MTFNKDKKANHLTPIATYGKNFKRLVLVDNPCLVADKDIPDVPQKLLSF